jgi:uncharacterized protein (TIGR02145 family)
MRNNILLAFITVFILFALITSCKKNDELPVPVSDIDGNTYKTIKIGGKTWMAENLRTTRYNDGTEIQLITEGSRWRDATEGGYCWYNNSEETSFREKYGALYNSYVIAKGNICPEGWSVPTKEDWLKLREDLGDTTTGGGRLKDKGTENWQAPNKGANNNSGFTALPAGIRYFEGTFSSFSYFTGFWSTSDFSICSAWYISLYYGDAIIKTNYTQKKTGFSIRCIKN